MPSLDLPEQRFADLFVTHLGEIRAAVAYVARKNRLSADEHDEFTGLVYLKLVDRDYAVFRKFGGRSSLRTYLGVVIQRLFLDERVRRWGRWRPSRRTRRQGPVAVLLDRLIAREGVHVEQACSRVRAVHGPHACENLRQLSEQLPRRTARRHINEAVLRDMPSPAPGADKLIESAERHRAVDRTARALATAFAALPKDDRLILQLRFGEDLKIPEIAARLKMPCPGSAKHLYSRIQRQLTSLGAALERAGVNRSEVLEAIGAPDTPAIRLFPRARPALRHRPEPSKSEAVAGKASVISV